MFSLSGPSTSQFRAKTKSLPSSMLAQELLKHLSTIVLSRFADPPSSMTSEFDAFPGTPLKQKYLIPEMV